MRTILQFHLERSSVQVFGSRVLLNNGLSDDLLDLVRSKFIKRA